MNNRNWTTKIVNHNWPYADVPKDATGYDSNTDAKTLYTREVELWINGENKGTNLDKIGLMYAHDYALATSNESKCHSSAGSSGYTKCKASWIHLSNNDTSDPGSGYEWTMSRSAGSFAWYLYSDGDLYYYYNLTNAYSVRPVFYIDTDFAIASGSGTIEDPYIFEEPIDNTETLTSVCNSYKTMSECVQKGNLDEIENLETKSNMEERADNLRRYQGRTAYVNNNYICLGSNKAEDCDLTNTTNSDKYSYRIIGIVEKNNNVTQENIGQIKVIKTEALNTAYQWHNGYGSDSYTWGLPSALNTGINGTYFLGTLSNDPYKLHTNIGTTEKTWADNVIASHTWPYADVPDSLSGYFSSTDAKTLYTREVGLWINGENNGTIASKEDNTYKIGLMYVHDYSLSISNSALCHYSAGNESEKCKASWIRINNNDTSPISHYEWTMTRSWNSIAWTVDDSGSVRDSYYLFDSYSVRPVFYLSEKIKLSGNGTKENPYIITGVSE